jgi:HlyD family secretion protein
MRISIVLLMILLGWFLLFPPNRKPPPSYQTQRVTRGNLILTVNATGSAQASADNITFPSASTTGTSSIFLQSVDPSLLQIVADVNESDMANVKVGDVVQFTVSAYGNRIFTGVVSYIVPSGVSVSNVVTFPVYVDVDTNDLQGATLLPGMTANVTIDVAKRTNVLLIPVNAVNYAHTASTPSTSPNAPPPLISADQVRVAQSQARQLLMQLQRQNPTLVLTDNPTPTFVLEQKNGQLIAKPVVLGLTDGTYYEVLAGLSLGEIIIVGVAGP